MSTLQPTDILLVAVALFMQLCGPLLFWFGIVTNRRARQQEAEARRKRLTVASSVILVAASALLVLQVLVLPFAIIMQLEYLRQLGADSKIAYGAYLTATTAQTLAILWGAIVAIVATVGLRMHAGKEPPAQLTRRITTAQVFLTTFALIVVGKIILSYIVGDIIF